MKLNSKFLLSALVFGSGISTFSSVKAEDRALHNVPKATASRFPITDRIWPENPGDADVCIWKDDKLGAVTVTIDDDQAGQIDWWVEQGEMYGYRFTWFIITNWVGNKGVGGKWEQFQEVVKKGHDVQSHTVSHLSDKELDIADEYRMSKQIIEEHIPGHPVTTVAYPGGGQSHRNNHDAAARYFIAARGTSAVINKVNRMDYMSVSSVSGQFVFNNPGTWADLGHMIERTRQKSLYRGWYCAHFHNLKPKNRDHVVKAFDYLKSHEDTFWVGLFREVAMYAQERDTAEVATKIMSPAQIALSLRDRMDDTIYDFPLTVKVRLPDDWQAAIAGQNQRQIECTVAEHEGAKFALVQAVPDAGTVYLRKN
ncbi:polysaccharide deacetylase family protein [Kiritimatiellaeota bacterium B1221]|nr:polysaccharide deacetylase family protein [Kiritimatiellaeota bacterium B1221]